jgi:gliding motility-associated-like protein
MRYRFLTYLLFLFFVFNFTYKGNSQAGLCPNNMDFESGDFSNWTLRTGTMDNAGNIFWDASPLPGRHLIIDAATAGYDPFGGFKENAPNGSAFSMKLGNQINGRGIESISYTYTIPGTLTQFSMLFHYAVVLESPGHSLIEQPRFQARIIDMSTNNPLPCVDFDFIPGSSTGGFRLSTVPGNGGSQVLYKDWTPISINLNGYIGRTIMLEFITRDCTLGGHAGYAYVDVNSACNGAIQGSTVCIGDDSTTLVAPFGFQAYTWYSDITFSTVIANTQSITLTPPPTVGTVFPVVVEPFVGFGCRDTLYATITVSPKPPADAGPDQNICVGNTVQVGGPPLPAHQYSWTPAALVSNPFISNPFAGPVTGSTEFIVQITDILTGCKSTDTTIIDNFLVDDAIQLTGPSSICINDPASTLSVNNTSTNVQWYEVSTGLIAGATGLTYQPTVTGSYWAEITQGGCVDSTVAVLVSIHPLPLPSFNMPADSGCVAVTTFQFNNTSTTPDGSAMSYVWKFSDNTFQVTPDATKSFPAVGVYTVKLIATTEFGCADSTGTQSIYVLPKGFPNFRWDSICVGKPVLFTNLSNENSSPQVTYVWDFNNGDPLLIAKDPPPVFYNTTPGQLDVTLKMVTLGCETDTVTIVKTVQVNKQAQGISYKVQTVPEGSSRFVHVRDSIGDIYNWRPRVQLSRYTTQYTEFFAVDDVTYLIDITDLHTCVTTDTMQLLVLKKPGYYLPTAFTPNGDGLNDLARPYLVGMKGLKSFSIFNRWGTRVFYSTKEGQGWDGKYMGEDQNSGMFVWILEFYDQANKLVTEKGTLTLIR